jgi:3-hydroxyacyl-[acyl-carrier-protein] dehydratase
VSTSQPEAVPHRFPFRLVERVEHCNGGCYAVALATAGGELARSGAWPVTLVAEALAQAILLVAPPPAGGTLRLVGLDGVRSLQPVLPGDRLLVEVQERAAFGALRRFSCRAVRAGALAATAEVTVSS